jgi:hypothetical protein
MYGSTPTGWSQSYAYYITHEKPNGEKVHIPCGRVDNQILPWLKSIAVDPKLIPAIRGIYETEIKQVSENDKQTRVSELNRQRSQLKEEEAKLGRLFITGKMSEEAYNQLRREWQEKLRHLELTIAELEREATFHLDDLDAALALMAKVADLYPRLEKKQQGILLQILAKQIIVDPQGAIIEHELNSPFVYLRSLTQSLSTPGNGDGSSEHVRSGALISQKPPTHDIEGFLSMLRFDSREKVHALGHYVDPEANTTAI